MAQGSGVAVTTIPSAPRPIQPRILARLAGAAAPSDETVALSPPSAPGATSTAGTTSANTIDRSEPPVATSVEPDLTDEEVGGRWGLARPSRLLPLLGAMALLVAGVVLLTNRPGGGPAPGEALVSVDGVAIVSRAAGGTDRITSRTKLLPGDRLVMEKGTADLELNDDVSYTALGPVGSSDGTDLQMGRLPALSKGPLLVAAPRDTTVDAGTGTVTVTGGSVVRVARTIAVRVDVFRGTAVLASAGADQRVGALRSAEIVAAGDLSRPRPLTYDAAEPWDRRYLGPALALDRQLAPLVAGLRASNADAAVLGSRMAAQPGLRLTEGQVAAVIADRTNALDAVIGTVITAVGGPRVFTDQVADAFDFHDKGAEWGLVAMDQGADPDAVIDALTSAIDVAPLPAAASGSKTGSALQDPTASEGTSTDPTGASAGGVTPGAPGDGTDPADGGQTGEPLPGTSGLPIDVGGGGVGVTIPPVGGPGGVTVPGVTVPGVSVPGVSTGGGGVDVTLPPVSTPVVGAGGTGVSAGSGGVIITPPSVSVPGVTVPVVTVPGVTTGSGGILGGGSLTVPVTVPAIGPLLGG